MAENEIGKFKLTGWRAVAVIAGVLVFFVWRNFVVTSTVDAEDLSELKWQLLGEYSSQNLGHAWSYHLKFF